MSLFLGTKNQEKWVHKGDRPPLNLWRLAGLYPFGARQGSSIQFDNKTFRSLNLILGYKITDLLSKIMDLQIKFLFKTNLLLWLFSVSKSEVPL